MYATRSVGAGPIDRLFFPLSTNSTAFQPASTLNTTPRIAYDSYPNGSSDDPAYQPRRTWLWVANPGNSGTLAMGNRIPQVFKRAPRTRQFLPPLPASFESAPIKQISSCMLPLILGAFARETRHKIQEPNLCLGSSTLFRAHNADILGPRTAHLIV